MTKQRTPAIVFQPAAAKGFESGIGQIVGAVRPTLGPYPRHVVCENAIRSRGPELLDNGGVIARRIIQLGDREADMGAMYVRQMLWQLHERVGDGTATAAVLFQAVYREACRMIAGGWNAMQLRKGLEASIQPLLDDLTCQTVPLQGKAKLAQVAETMCHDPELGSLLGEILDLVGEDGSLDIRAGHGRAITREYTAGTYWEGGLLSRQAACDPAQLRIDLQNAAILISDLAVDDARDLLPLLTLALEAKHTALVLVVKSLSDQAIGLVRGSRLQERMKVVVVKTPGASVTDQAAALEDLAVLTGGRPVLVAAGETLVGVKLDVLGQARRAWADNNYFGLSAGKGAPRRLRQHIAALRAAAAGAQDRNARRKFQQRIGRLMGGSATLWIGGASDTEIKVRQASAERTAQALRGALAAGVLPGGGVALLACRPGLETRRNRCSVGTLERAVCDILLRAVEQPARTLIANAGYDASSMMAAIQRAGPGYGVDLNRGKVVEMLPAGIVDAATTTKEAVRTAISSAALALTIDVLVCHRQPVQAQAP